MLQFIFCHKRERRPALLAASLALAVAALVSQPAFALIEGGEGNQPIEDRGWPTGAEPVFNNPSRVAHWVGPPFGGGQWHAECRGDTATLNDVLKAFAKIEAKTKRLVAHDGIGHSFWLNPNNEAGKADAARIDWVVMIWEKHGWDQLKAVPVGIRPPEITDAEEAPVQIDVYTGGNVRWDDVIVPAGIEVIDEQLEAHGFHADDGTVLEGNVIDVADNKPITARVELQLIETKPKGGYKYTPSLDTESDAKGHWKLKKVPAGWYQIVASAEGFVPRVIGYGKFEGKPRWQSFDLGLSRAGAVSGQVVDDDGKPLPKVEVQLYDVDIHGTEYNSPKDYRATTDADGRFHIEPVPIGSARAVPNKLGYCRPGLGDTFSTPATDLTLKMVRAAQLRATVEFRDGVRRGDYIVELEPEGGNVVGSWGGSANIDAKNGFTFENVPPGRYFLEGHPNPTTEEERTKKMKVDLKGGETTEITLKAK